MMVTSPVQSRLAEESGYAVAQAEHWKEKNVLFNATE